MISFLDALLYLKSQPQERTAQEHQHGEMHNRQTNEHYNNASLKILFIPIKTVNYQ